MSPGDTVLGLDPHDHLWIVLSNPVDGAVAVINITTHRQGCPDPTFHLDVGDHPFVIRRSCVRYQDAYMNPLDRLMEAVNRGVFPRREPLGAELLRAVQHGALQSRFTPYDVQDAVRYTLDNG